MPKQPLEVLKQQRDKINHRIQAVEARERTAQRKQDLQRAILVGRYMLKKAKQEGRLEQLYTEMSNVLMRATDRKLFVLALKIEEPQKIKAKKILTFK